MQYIGDLIELNESVQLLRTLVYCSAVCDRRYGDAAKRYRVIAASRAKPCADYGWLNGHWYMAAE
jgi:hypothetical protein